MGARLSWVAVQRLGKDEALRRAGLRDTGSEVWAHHVPFSWAEIPGWVLLYAKDPTYFSVQRQVEISDGCLVVGCQIHEGAMCSGAHSAADGQASWSVAHFSEQGVDHLDISGTPPAQLIGIRDSLAKQQEEEGGEAAMVDFFFDIPVELAAGIVGYRHDGNWVEPKFIAAEPV